ncbi:hypothetical protein [Aeromonas dhakensis]|uniref:hypothetical protein n=1 Tax=Aeromonas dhakensis TaxID=196024 RepID=UPI002B46E368|nr:hypothetical protein [Aeromonas dhakensis]
MSSNNLPNEIIIDRHILKSLIKSYSEEVKKEHGWATPLSVAISIFLCIVATTSFKGILGLSSEQMGTIVWILFILSIFSTAHQIYRACKCKAEESLYKNIYENIKNIPDNTVIYIIKLTRDNIPRLLVEKKPSWGCYFLPYSSKNGDSISEKNISDFKKTISSYLGISNEDVSVDHLKDFPLKSSKFSPKDKVYKQFNFDFLFFTIPKEKMLENYESSPFCVGGRTFEWMTIPDLQKDHKTLERNGDIIDHLDKNYTELLSKLEDSFH